MTPALSLYLDLLRAGAALVVFLGHLSWQRLSGGALWWLQGIGHDAVMLFFVLSGYLIQHVAQQREAAWRPYLVARLARLYSVVLPALLLTVLCDAVGQRLDPSLYDPDRQTEPVWRLLANAAMLAQSWGWQFKAFTNEPFWSLPYEFWYYMLFGVARFGSGTRRLAGLLVCGLLAGPSILLYLPIWWMGVQAHRWGQRRPLGPAVAACVFAGSWLVVGLVLHADLRDLVPRATAPGLPHAFSVVDYLTGAAFALNLYAAQALIWPCSQRLRSVQARAAAAVRWVAGWSFTLYLCHLPLLTLTATAMAVWGPAGWTPGARAAAMVLLTLAVVIPLARLTEQQKGRLAQGIHRVWDRLAAR